MVVSALLTLLPSGPQAQGAIITQYQTLGSVNAVSAGNALPATLTDPRVTAGPLSFVGLTPSGFAGYRASGWTSNATPDLGQYLSFSVDPTGFIMVLDTLQYRIQPGDQTNVNISLRGPATWQVRTSLDGFSTALATISSSVGNPSFTWTIDVSSLGFISTPVEFRLYGYEGGQNSAGIGVISPWITLNGTVLPEPGTIVGATLVTLIGAGLIARRRRRSDDSDVNR